MAAGPVLVVVVGPGAVGKMTVGQEVSARTGFPLLHNHVTIEALLPLFAYSSPSFQRLNQLFRVEMLTEAAASLPGLVLTYIWAFDEPGEAETVASYTQPFLDRGGRVVFAELAADLDVRLERNRTPARLEAKPSKRDLDAAEHLLVRHHERYRMNTTGEHDHRDDWLRIDTTDLPPDEVADRIIRRFDLPTP